MTLLLHISPGNSFGENKTSEIDTRIYQFTGDKTVTDIRLDFLDMTVLNSFLLWTACGNQMTYTHTLLTLPLA
jgi:hypothetical protein